MIVKYPSIFVFFLVLWNASSAQEFKPVKPRSIDEMQFLATNPFRKLKQTSKGNATQKQPPGSYALLGVVTRGGQVSAYLKDKKTGKTIKAEKDIEKDGITLLEVNNGRINQETFVTVRTAGGEMEISFDIEAKKSSAAKTGAKRQSGVSSRSGPPGSSSVSKVPPGRKPSRQVGPPGTEGKSKQPPGSGQLKLAPDGTGTLRFGGSGKGKG